MHELSSLNFDGIFVNKFIHLYCKLKFTFTKSTKWNINLIFLSYRSNRNKTILIISLILRIFEPLIKIHFLFGNFKSFNFLETKIHGINLILSNFILEMSRFVQGQGLVCLESPSTFLTHTLNWTPQKLQNTETGSFGTPNLFLRCHWELGLWLEWLWSSHVISWVHTWLRDWIHSLIHTWIHSLINSLVHYWSHHLIDTRINSHPCIDSIINMWNIGPHVEILGSRR